MLDIIGWTISLILFFLVIIGFVVTIIGNFKEINKKENDVSFWYDYFIEMSRIGYIKHNNIKYEIYVKTDDTEHVPHFHIRDCESEGENFETCISLKTNKYCCHGQYYDVLNHSFSETLANFMESPNKYFPNNYMATVYAWNTDNNLCEKVIPIKDNNGNIIVPDYRNID